MPGSWLVNESSYTTAMRMIEQAFERGFDVRLEFKREAKKAGSAPEDVYIGKGPNGKRSISLEEAKKYLIRNVERFSGDECNPLDGESIINCLHFEYRGR